MTTPPKPPEETKLQQLEADALRGDKEAIAYVIAGLRRYRSITRHMLSLRYRDGEVDGCTLSLFESSVDDIENVEGD